MKKLAVSLVLVNLLAACATTHNTTPPVVDKSTNNGAAANNGANSNAAAPAPAAQLNPLKDPSNILSHRSVYYDFDSYAVKDEYKPLVNAHAGYLVAHPDAKVVLEGNTDARGSREYNLALGQKRAESVRSLLAVQGVKAGQMETVSFGKEKPKAQGSNEEAWSQNRRTDIRYQGE